MVLIGPWTARQCSLFIGTVYPIYQSTRVLQRLNDKHELLQWITFWTVNAIFCVGEVVGDRLMGGWMPLYYEAKLVFLLWLVLPTYRGARVLYEQWLAPTFEQHEEVIDVTLLQMKHRASEKVVQVCKHTADLALKRGSEVVIQSQHYVASQLVQQALGKLQPPDTQEMRMPTMLSSLLSATVATALSTPTSASASGPSSPQHKTVEKAELYRSEPKASLPVVQEEMDLKERKETTNHPPTLPSKPAADKIEPLSRPSLLSPVSQHEKSKELVTHFKKLLVQGFDLQYHSTTTSSSKQRILRLAHANARYLVFESSSTRLDKSSKPKKSVLLYVHTLRQIKAGVPSSSSSTDWSTVVDPSIAFVVDHGKTSLLFEAKNTKTRDLMVAGIRLWMNEHRRQDTNALLTITKAFERLQQQYVLDLLKNNKT